MPIYDPLGDPPRSRSQVTRAFVAEMVRDSQRSCAYWSSESGAELEGEWYAAAGEAREQVAGRLSRGSGPRD